MNNEPPAKTDDADPSMEEILASIRRILNDDDAPAEPPAAVEPAAVKKPAVEQPPVDKSPVDDDVFLLDQSMMVSNSEAQSDLAHHQSADPEPAAAAAIAAPLAALPPPTEPRHHEMEAVTPTLHPDASEQPIADLVAPEAAAAAASSVGSLMRTLAAGRGQVVYAGGPTLEDIVRAELRPLLKQWLDANLPPMVERLVRAEIERVVGHVVP